MSKDKTLSEAVHMDELEPQCLNIIQAPVGSGKTYWARNAVVNIASAPSKVIYLIDTINGKNQLIAQKDMSEYSDKWFYVVQDDIKFFDEEDYTDKVVVMTYGKFGSLVEMAPEFGIQFEYIICDEIHNLPHFSAFQSNTPYHKIAQQQLEDIINYTNTIVIGLSATPERADRHMNCDKKYITVDNDVRTLATEQTLTYTNLQRLLSEQPKDEKGILYVEQIEKMVEVQNAAMKMGFCAIALWSPNNVDHPMKDEQREALNYIIDKEELPEPYNLFIINASCQTSINIYSRVDYIIVHKQEHEAQVQVRGRYRDRLKRFYYLDYSTFSAFPTSSMGIRLYADDRRKLCEELNMRNNNGRLCMWITIEKKLLENGYRVLSGKDKIGRYRIVTQDFS